MFKRRRRKLAITVWLGLAVSVLVYTFIIVERHFLPAIVDIARAKAVQVTVNNINEAVKGCIQSQSVNYQDLVSLHKDNEGRIVMMQANTGRISELAADFALAAEGRIRGISQEEFVIPLGQALGSQLLATYGPRIPVQVIPVGAVRVNMVDKFEGAGINQTRHSIYLDLDTQVQVVVPWQKTEVRVATRVPLVENIVVGDVPLTYVNLDSGLLGNGLFKITEPVRP
ncbi:MAG: sporulation protein YunB [Bacillota bacterium]|uniref:sporulation protein YunB n=1 Tax=unclassified Candidatus Desulforudis TaxID=2635950 RepID=UPI00348D84A2